MALEEHDREDLLRDGLSMPERGECRWADQGIFCGFRPGGELSFYFGADPMFQFDAAGRLRRAFVEGRRIAAAGDGRLLVLVPPERGGRLRMLRQPMAEPETRVLLGALEGRLAAFEQALREGRLRWRGATIEPRALEERLAEWFERLPRPLSVAPPRRLRGPRSKR